MENIESKKPESGNDKSQKLKSEKVVLCQVSFRVTKEKLKFLKCHMIDKDTSINKFFNDLVDKMMTLAEKENIKKASIDKPGSFDGASDIQ
ncbi:hypothetical protein [Castellaniella sp.]|uniref:hypothetical protein n=1 Tax=Castellaniella sp. TaxID=1955812 RepID=UPI002AFE28F5|nr:hypothetical protein [Castellaniella sp.]